MLDDVGFQERQRLVLGLVGRAHHGPDDQIGVDEFHDMTFVAGEQLRPGFAPMAHLRISEGRHAIGRDATPAAALAGRRVRLQVLGQHAAERGEGGLDGRRIGDRHVGRDPRFHTVDFGYKARQGIRRRCGIPPVDIQRRFQAGRAQQRDARPGQDLRARDLERRRRARHYGPQRAAEEIPRILDAAATDQWRRIQRGPHGLPPKVAGLLGQHHGAIE
jgi:hypothetical protein